MKKNALVLMMLMVFSGLTMHAQKIVVKSGDFNFLKGQKVVLVTFDYSNVAVGKYDKEADYIAAKVEEYNKATPGRGDSWKESWLSDRPERFEPKFEELFNQYLKPRDIKCDKDVNDAKYEMQVITTFVEPGFNVGVMRKDATINATVKFIDSASGKEMAELEVTKCPGREAFGNDYDTGLRIQEAYAMLGKALAGYIGKRIK